MLLAASPNPLRVLLPLQDGPCEPGKSVQDLEKLTLLDLAHAVEQHAVALERRRHQFVIDVGTARGERDADAAALAPGFAQHQAPYHPHAPPPGRLAFVEAP